MSVRSARRRRFRWMLVAFNAAALVVAVFLGLEVRQRWEIRAAETRNALIHQNRRRNATMTEATDASLWLDSARTRYRPNASLSMTIDGQLLAVSINDHGMRGPDVDVPKPEGTFRILCLGGSTTVEGPTNETTYPALLERRLRENFHDRQIEVLNGGVSGLRAFAEPARLEELLVLQPDLVIEYNAVNDICWSIIPDFQAQAALWQKALRRSRYVALNRESWIRPRGQVPDRVWEQRVFSHLRAIHELCEQNGIDVMFCSFCRPCAAEFTETQREYFDYDLRMYWSCPYTPFDEYCRLVDEYNARLKDWCKREDVMYLPVAETVQPGPDAFFDLCHMHSDAIEAKAEAISGYVIRYLDARE